MNIFDKLNKKRTAQYYGAVGLVKGKYDDVASRHHGEIIYDVVDVESYELHPNESYRSAIQRVAFERDIYHMSAPSVKKIIYCKSLDDMRKAEKELQEISRHKNQL